MIEQMVTEMGRRWAEIARRLGNRSDNAVKNWWNGSMNRRKRNGNQRQPGFKSMGQRTQPIPATRPPRPAFIQPPPHIEYHQQIQQGPPTWPDTHQARINLPAPSMHYSEPPTPGVYQMFDPRLLEADRDRNHHYGNAITPVTDSFPRYSHQTHGGYPEHLPVPSTLPRLHYNAPQTLHFSHGSSGELPLISPMGSEASFAPPSLVSDRHSSYSISPKTIPSPRPNMLAPIDTRTQLWHEQTPRRRESFPAVESKPLQADEGYVSAITPGTVMGVKQYHHVSGYEVHRSHSQNGYRSYQDQPAAPDMSPNSAKDARMNVSSLLH